MAASETKTIGLFGYYGQYNFGDDLMAALFAKAIVDCGAKCLVFGMDGDAGDRYRVDTTQSLERLVDASCLIVYGGGGLLLPQPADQPYSQTVGRLTEMCAQRSTPVVCLSIGGDRLPLNALTPARRRLASYATYVSLRDPHEASVLREAGFPAEFFEDVVWTTPAAFPSDRPARGENPRNRIAVNLYPEDAAKAELELAFAAIAEKSSATEWFFVETHTYPPEYRQAYCPGVSCPRYQPYQFQDVEDGLDFIAQCDLVVSSRLHVGIVAMSLGIPCLALLPAVKTRNCFEHLGLSGLCWGADGIGRLNDLDEPRSRSQLMAPFRQLDVPTLQESAQQHLERLRESVARAVA